MRGSFARASGRADDLRWACGQGSTTGRMLGCVLKSAAQEGALGLAFEAVGELAPGACEQAGHLLFGFTLAGLDQRLQDAAQQPTPALCGRRYGSVVGESGGARWEFGEGREGGRHGVLLRRWAHLSQALPGCWSCLLAEVSSMLQRSKEMLCGSAMRIAHGAGG